MDGGTNMDNIIIKDGMANMNFEKITKMLSNSFWSSEIKIDEVKKGAINSALVVGAFLNDVYQWLLITKDAHGVYSKVGFNPVSRPLDWMEIRKNRPKR